MVELGFLKFEFFWLTLQDFNDSKLLINATEMTIEYPLRVSTEDQNSYFWCESSQIANDELYFFTRSSNTSAINLVFSPSTERIVDIEIRDSFAYSNTSIEIPFAFHSRPGPIDSSVIWTIWDSGTLNITESLSAGQNSSSFQASAVKQRSMVS